jgi:ATP-binding cassette subfamily F protein uup
MPLLELRDVTLAFGGPPLLEGVRLRIDRGERVVLLGRNGSGKSSLLRLVLGEIAAEDGEVAREPGARVSLLTQQVPPETSGSVYRVVAAGLGDVGRMLAEHHRLSVRLAEAGDGEARWMRQLEKVQHELEAAGGWQLPTRVEAVLSRLDLPADADFEALSGGLERRVLLARALVAEPDLLLLDEPTNHLDLAAIEGLEELLLSFRGAVLFVTHDRAFLRRLATRIVDLDRGRLSDWPGDYDAYLSGKEKQLEVEARHADAFDKKLAQEEVWIRQGIKARRTRNEGRVRALEKLRDERRARRSVEGEVRMSLGDAERSGKRVIEARGVSFAYDGGSPIVRDFSTRLLRGDKIGILGPNGSGKTTLLRLLLGELQPAAGEVHHGTRLEVAYFDQHREQLDLERSVADNVADGNDRVSVGGKARHVIGYLQDFLFPAARARSPVKSLSGGERHRLLLARLFTRPFNLLVMDEPTNDLDVETLELLEGLLVEFTGTLLLVSHDRDFLDHVVTSTLAFEGGGKVGEYVGGYSDYQRQRRAAVAAEPRPKPARSAPPRETQRPRRLGYREKQELETLPATIESLEAEQGGLFDRLADPDFYRREGAEVGAARTRLEELEGELARAYERWQELESIAGLTRT